MRSSIYWINHPGNHRLGIMARPRAGDWLRDEIGLWKDDGVDVVLCLLEKEEVDELELQDEESLCASMGISFISFPIVDRGVPDAVAARKLAEHAAGRLEAGAAVAIHCRAGIGRSSLMAGAIMVASGMGATEALKAIEAARGLHVPDTDEQREWLVNF